MVEGGGEKCLVGEGSGDWAGRLVSWEVLTVLSGDHLPRSTLVCRGLLAWGDRWCSSRGLVGLGLPPDFISALCSAPASWAPGDCFPPPSSDLMLAAVLPGVARPPWWPPALLLLFAAFPSPLPFC